MKKLILLSLIVASCFSITKAQVVREVMPKKVILKPGQMQKSPTPAPVTPKQETNPTVALVYTLVAVKATIKTGSDNKEYPSKVEAFLSLRNQLNAPIFSQLNLNSEMKVNSFTEFGLEKKASMPITLEAIQNAGLEFKIAYTANFRLDAWKIEGVTLNLDFRDQYGNSHPNFANRPITFNTAVGFLNGLAERTMICNIDGSLNPLSAFIKNTY